MIQSKHLFSMPPRRFFYVFSVVLAITILASCVTSTHNKFQSRGSVTYWSDDIKLSARFLWQQLTPENYHLRLFGPFGKSYFDLRVFEGVSQLTDNKGKIYKSYDPEVLITQLSGITLPLNGLRYWLFSLPLPALAQDTARSIRAHSPDNMWPYDTRWQVIEMQEKHTHTSFRPKQLELKNGAQRIKLKVDP